MLGPGQFVGAGRSSAKRYAVVAILAFTASSGLHEAAAAQGRDCRVALNQSMAVERLQAAVEQITRLGALGAVLAVESPCLARTSVAAGFKDSSRSTGLSPDHGFQMASISKTFAATAILVLVKEGKISLDDRLSAYYDGFIGSRETTIRHVLTHTSGIADGVPAYWQSQIFPEDHYTLDDVALLSRLHGQQFDPGERFQYNELGIMSLARVVQAATGTGIADFLRERVLSPLNLDDTYFGAAEPWPLDRMARGYHREPGGDTAIDVNASRNLTWAQVAGDVVSTADDILDFGLALLDEAQPLGVGLADYTADPYVFEPPSAMTRYGYGLAEMPIGGVSMWGHLGGIYGYRSLWLFDPQSGVHVVVLVSASGAESENLDTIYRMGLFQAATAAVHTALPR